MARIVHLSSAHPRSDTRIFVKQCRSLASQGHEVSLVVADGLGDAYVDGIPITDVGRSRGRRERMLRSTWRVGRAAMALDADVYQLHDPELLPVGLRLRFAGRKVVFDAHEDVPTQLLDKPYLSPFGARLLAASYGLLEKAALRRFDGVLAATALIRDRLSRIHPRTIEVNNFPCTEEFCVASDTGPREHFCYVGSISAIRGVRELVKACALLRAPARLSLAGSFAEPELEAEVARYPGWNRVDALGHLDRQGVAAVMSGAFAGLVTLLPTASYRDALPVKMFEYMAAGIPVIASDFPLWRNIVEGNRCGLCVDPHDPAAIAAAIDFLADKPALAREMGARGRRAVLERYNWENEAGKLAAFYTDLLAPRTFPEHPGDKDSFITHSIR
ncbi:glycosyltransferase family 4 protein [Massilia sp. MS-15]|uniref:glycosyltransferase family 4 protein n=1 Tax=Massilia sp. MS-15 TaxID=2878200 RepID=UPI001CD2D7F8|nr:glycosyltransferase family 4 protein [Massilia sp. MS-15]MCA1246225.1 glycosyltransferase family 4 protein [Massilia sp. MS-15]